MKKLLHERLRDISECNSPVIAAMGYMKCAGERALFQALADEIERYYKPCPRFEDGEPLDQGEHVDYFGRPEEVVSYLVSSNDYATLHLRCGASHNVTISEPLKRPSFKPLDADGVEINIGDRVWDIDLYFGSTNAGRVISFDKDLGGQIFAVYENKIGTYKVPVDRLTHKEPDNQKRIDADEALSAEEYCDKYGIAYGCYDEAAAEQYCDLFRRQRKLMGGDAL